MDAKRTHPNAFTLIELLVVIAAIGILSSAGYFTVTSMRETARESKLETDVATLNSAIQLYQANGGDLSSASTADAVLAKLKTRGDADAAAYQVGLKGSFIDPRITPVPQSTDESGSSQSRAVWNNTTKRFAVATTGAGGIKEFALDESLAADAPLTEARSRTLTAANVASETPAWIWDYTDATPVTYNEGGIPVTVSGTGPGSPTAATLAKLDPPEFELGTGTYSLSEIFAYDSTVAANGTFKVKISKGNGNVPSHIDIGSPVEVAANSGVGTGKTARVISDDPDVWQDSDPVTATYEIEQLEPVVAISVSDTSLTPFEIGVPPASGSAGSVTATATITNWSDIPPPFQVADNFTLAIVTGTNNPLQAPGAPQQTATLGIGLGSPWTFTTDTATLQLGAAVNAVNEVLFVDSSVETETVTVTLPTLSAQFSPASGSTLSLADTITISANGDLPASYSIRYTTDGSTPSAGNGATYGGPFNPATAGNLTVKAIVLPDNAYSSWFKSPVATASYTVSAPAANPQSSGILTSSLTLNSNALINGSVTIVPFPNSSLKYDMNSNARVTGDIFFPGLPTIVRNTNVTITGGIVDLTGATTPVYTVTFNANSFVGGTVYRRATPPEVPTISLPTGLPTFGGQNVGNNRTVTLAPGTYTGPINVNTRGTVRLGTAGSTTPAQYVFNGFNLNSNAKVEILGPVVITMTQTINLNSNTVFGNPANPEWLQLNILSGDVNVNSNVAVYAQIVSPNGKVTFNSGATFKGSVTAKEVIMNSNSSTVEFTLPAISADNL